MFKGKGFYINNIVLINFVVDCFTSFGETGGVISLARAIIVYTILPLYLIKNKYFAREVVWILLFIVYTTTLIFFSSNIFDSTRLHLRIIAPFILFVIAYSHFRNNQLDVNKFIITTLWILPLFIVNWLVSSYFDFGRLYGTGIAMGSLSNELLYAPSISIVLYIFALKKGILNKIEISIFSVSVMISLILLLLSTRRIAIATAFLGILLFLYLSNNGIKKITSIATGGLILLSLIYVNKDKINEQFETTRRTYNVNELENEYRFLEIAIVVTEVIQDSKTLLFGKEIWNSEGNYNEGKWGDRPIHVDYLLILHGSGLMGLILYLLMYFYITKKVYFFKYDRLLRALSITLIVLSLLISISGQMFGVTFRSLIFICVAGVMSIGNSTSRKINSKIPTALPPIFKEEIESNHELVTRCS